MLKIVVLMVFCYSATILAENHDFAVLISYVKILTKSLFIRTIIKYYLLITSGIYYIQLELVLNF